MGSRFRHWASVACAGFAIVGVGAAQDRDSQRPTVRSGIAIFEDADYGGRSRTFTMDVPNLSPSGFNDRISSVVVAPGEVWELCLDPNYGGQCTTITNWERNLADAGWNDKVSSMRRVRGRFGGRSGGGGLGEPGLELFAGANYSGQRKEITESVSNFNAIGFNDRAMSVRLIGTGSWELCVNADFDDCRVITGDVPDLEAIGLRRVVSSARPRASFRDGRGFRGFEREGIVLFAGPNFTGASMSIAQARSSLGSFNDRAQSARILSGRWELCDSQNFGGRCVVVTNDISNLRPVQLDGRVRSVRPR
jgi:hypothetical protein